MQQAAQGLATFCRHCQFAVAASFDVTPTESGHLPAWSSLQALLESLQRYLLASTQTHVRKDLPSLTSCPASHAKPRHVLNIPSFDFAQFSLSSPLQHHCGWKFPDGITLPFFAILPVLRIMTSNQHANCHTSGAAPKRQCPRLRNRPKMAAVAP